MIVVFSKWKLEYIIITTYSKIESAREFVSRRSLVTLRINIMSWSNTWFKICDAFNDWKGRLITEKGFKTAKGKKTLVIGSCIAIAVGVTCFKLYDWYQEREFTLRAQTAMRGGFYKEAFKNYLELANRGNEEAMLQIAEMYFEGQGTTKNAKMAIEYLQNAASSGNEQAMTKLGMLYFSSNYLSQTCLGHDYKQALDWFLKAKHNPEALEAIGTMYSRGLGVPVNERLAQNYFDKWINSYLEQARKGDAKAQYIMGLYFIDGLRHEINEAEAVSWFEKSAAQGYEKALESLGFLYRIGGEKIEPNDAKAMEYFSKLKDIYEQKAQHGDIAAMIYLAEMYQKGEGVSQNNEKVVKYYIDASNAGSIAAKENLADLSENEFIKLPQGVTPQSLRAEAQHLREAAAMNGDITLMKELGYNALGAITSFENVVLDSATNKEAELKNNVENKALEREAEPVVLSKNSADEVKTLANVSNSSPSEASVESSVSHNEDKAALSFVDQKSITIETIPDDNTLVVATVTANSEGKNIEDEPQAKDASVVSQDTDGNNKAVTGLNVSQKDKEELVRQDEVNSNIAPKVQYSKNVQHNSLPQQTNQELYALYDEALKWFTLAAESGDASAMLELGRIYKEAPLSSIKSEALAINWFEKSAKQCYEPAYIELGNVYAQENTALENAKDAIYWFERAAMQGSYEAQIALAKLFAKGGRGVQPDYISALKWLLVVKKGAEIRGDTGEESGYSDVLELEKKYSHYLTDEEVNAVHNAVEDMLTKYGTNW